MSYMKDEFDRVLKQYGHDIYLQRRIRSTGHDQGGWSDTFEIHTVRHMLTDGVSSQDEATEGVLNTTQRVYFFRKEAIPFDGDRIYEDDPRVTTTGWIIEGVIPLRGLNGDIEYYKAGATRFLPN